MGSGVTIAIATHAAAMGLGVGGGTHQGVC